MSDILQIIISIFGLIGIGVFCARTGYLDKDAGDRLADFVYKVPIPVLLARTMAGADFGQVSPWALWFAYFGGVLCVWLVAHVMIRRVFGRDARAGVVAGVSAGFANTVLIGIPVVQLAYGDAGVQYVVVIVAVHLPTLLAVGIVLHEWALSADGVRTGAIDRAALARKFFGGLTGNPVIYGIMAGLVWRMTGYTPFPALQILIDALAGISGPVALVSVGISVSAYGASRQ
ncbi:MAG: AEC family transporter, partial [Alphaproteobacteria bacterium]